MRAPVAGVGGYFLTEGEIYVLSVSCLFFDGDGSVCGCGCVYAQTHTHTVGYSEVSPGVRTRRLEGPENPDGLNVGIHVFVYAYTVHMCIYMLGGVLGPN